MKKRASSASLHVGSAEAGRDPNVLLDAANRTGPDICYIGEYKRVGVSEFDSIGNKSLLLDEIMRVTHARLRELRDRNSGHQPRLESTGPHHLQSRVKKSDISSSKLNYPNIGF